MPLMPCLLLTMTCRPDKILPPQTFKLEQHHLEVCLFDATIRPVFLYFIILIIISYKLFDKKVCLQKHLGSSL